MLHPYNLLLLKFFFGKADIFFNTLFFSEIPVSMLCLLNKHPYNSKQVNFDSETKHLRVNSLKHGILQFEISLKFIKSTSILLKKGIRKPPEINDFASESFQLSWARPSVSTLHNFHGHFWTRRASFEMPHSGPDKAQISASQTGTLHSRWYAGPGHSFELKRTVSLHPHANPQGAV